MTQPGEDSSELAPTPSARHRTREELADYLLDIGATLASYGCPSYRLEDVIRAIAEAEGYRARYRAATSGPRSSPGRPATP